MEYLKERGCLVFSGGGSYLGRGRKVLSLFLIINNEVRVPENFYFILN